MFDLDLKGTADWIKANGYDSVAIQLPEGLKPSALRISSELFSNTGANIVILGAPCYGACDLFVDFRKVAEALVHFGHSPMPCLGIDKDVRYVEVRVSADISEAVVKAAKDLPERIGLLATIQYIGLIDQTKEILESMGKNVFVGEGDRRVLYPGQILGCNYSTVSSVEKDVDAFLYIGEGDFHPLAAAFGVGKRMTVLNPLTGELRSIDDLRDRILRKRFANIEIAKTARSFLVIVCNKVGQDRSGLADDILNKIRASGKDAYMVILDEISPESLVSYGVDAYVSTACPRIAMDDSSKYRKPMLTPIEAEIVLGLRRWDDYKFDDIRNP
jgi:diphthamide biosynthesis enzyme Dph2